MSQIQFPGTLSADFEVDQRGGGYDQKILTTDITITANPTDPSGVTNYPWTVTYPTNLPSGSIPLSDPAPAPGSTVYNLTAVFTFNGVLSDVAAFVDMGPYMIN
jgi:hypothetical protein